MNSTMNCNGIISKENKPYDKNFILANVEYRLINAERNADILKKILHRKFLNLVVIYRVIIERNSKENIGLDLTDEMIQRLGISIEELEENSIKNTRADGFEIKSLADVLGLEANSGVPMYILSNSCGQNGANILLFPEEIKKVADLLNSDLWIIPSSIHEVIAIPITICGKEEINMIIQEVNNTQVNAEEILGYKLYKYSREIGKVEIA